MKWTKKEDQIIINSIKAGKKYSEIALEFKNTPGAIRARANRLNSKYLDFNSGKEIKKCVKCGKEFEDIKSKKRKFCSTSCSVSFSNIGKIKSEECKTKISNKLLGNKNSKPWAERVSTTCLYCNKEIIHKKSEVKKYHAKCYLKCSGGYRKGSGVGKKGWYKNYWCDSSWELAWIIYNIDHGIKFKRNTKKFQYNYNNCIRYYIPDFIVDDIYYEIKGFKTNQTEEKIKQFEHKLVVLYKKDLEYIFKYVISNYGKNYINLYSVDKNEGVV